MATLIKSISGIRGIVGDGLSPENLIKFTGAYAEFCNFGKIIVGRDSRITGDFIRNIVIGTLNSLGCDVIDLGICPTPTVEIYVNHEKANGGIIITASHNPIEYNALKLLNSTGMFLSPSEAKKYFQLVDSYELKCNSWDSIGKTKIVHNSWTLHLENIYALPIIDVDLIRSKKFNVLVDCVNGAGIDVVPKLLTDLGCSVTKYNCDSSGVFPRNPEPIPENLTSTISIAKEGNFDFTVIVDPDVDRLVLLTDQGEPFGEENTIALVADYVLSKSLGDVVINLSTTRSVEDIAKQYKVKVHRTPVGEINVSTKMKEVSAVIGGEGSGGVIYPPLLFGRDALVGIALVLQSLSESNKKLSTIKNEMPQYNIVKDKFKVSSINPNDVLAHFIQTFSNEKMNTSDGVRIDFEDHWIHIRKSNTEPIVRLIVEAKTENEAKNYMSRYKRLISDLK
ncbi:MAG: phosphoglucosamine mutase [Ignavibacteria bacterium]|nr:phosphoglucosamine mutase [Ignavibacteria bacterium]